MAPLFVGTLFLFSSCGEEKKVVEVWPTGAEKVVEFRNSKGELIRLEERHFNFLRSVEVPIQNGVPHGSYRSWRSDGTPEWSGQMKNGERDGLWTLWLNSKGAMLQQGDYQSGQLHGVWRSWHPNGQLREQGEWCGGKKCGVWENWNFDGQLISWSNCYSSDSLRQFRRFSRIGKVELEYDCVDSIKTGKWRRWDFLENLIEERHYSNDTLDGEQKGWFSNGSLRERSHYQMGRREGVQMTLSSDGDTTSFCKLEKGSGRCQTRCLKNLLWICADSSWKEGQLDGEVMRWNLERRMDRETWSNGELLYRKQFKMTPVVQNGDTTRWESELRHEGSFADGKKSGIWRLWGSHQRLLEEAHYEKGELLGEQRIYDSTGTLRQRRIHHGKHRGVTIENIEQKSSF